MLVRGETVIDSPLNTVQWCVFGPSCLTTKLAISQFWYFQPPGSLPSGASCRASPFRCLLIVLLPTSPFLLKESNISLSCRMAFIKKLRPKLHVMSNASFIPPWFFILIFFKEAVFVLCVKILLFCTNLSSCTRLQLLLHNAMGRRAQMSLVLNTFLCILQKVLQTKSFTKRLFFPARRKETPVHEMQGEDWGDWESRL